MKIGNKGIGHRREGDRLRAERRWADAAAAYRRHLAERPGDQPIYVQLGHMLKEQGRPADALGAYAAAVALDETDADATMFMAEALRLLGHSEVARDTYRRSFDIVPSEEAARQLMLLAPDELGGTAVRDVAAPTTFFVLQDLFGYLRAHVTMSGIQRVQVGIALHAMADPNTSARFILNHIELRTEVLPPGEFWMLDEADLSALIRYASGETLSHDVLRGLILNAERRAVRVRPAAGSTIVLLGAFWGIGNAVSTYLASHRAGVRIGAYIYDIIPVTHPEFCDDDLAVDFSKAICDLASIADFALTISDASGRALREFLRRHGGREFPIATVPLAHRLTQDSAPARMETPALRALRNRRYVAYVSTIEARKNHLYVVEAWRRLIEEGVDVPDLVFVGRRGWKVAPLFDVLATTGNLGGKIHLVHDLSDGELNAIYAGSLFTVFTSIVEGWGLPVGESLGHGRPCIASSSSSIPEVGGDLVDYVDVLNLRDGIGVFRRMITDHTYREARAAEIRARFKPSGWEDVAKGFIVAMKAFEGTPSDPSRLALRDGLLCWLGNEQGPIDFSDYLRTPRRMVVDLTGFDRPDRFAVWMRGISGELQIEATLPPGTLVYVYVALLASPSSGTCVLRIEDLDVHTGAALAVPIEATRRGVRIPVTIPEDGRIRIRFSREDGIETTRVTPEPSIGLVAVGYAGVNDLHARQELTEQISLHTD